jgi:hypothetical protein
MEHLGGSGKKPGKKPMGFSSEQEKNMGISKQNHDEIGGVV